MSGYRPFFVAMSILLAITLTPVLACAKPAPAPAPSPGPAAPVKPITIKFAGSLPVGHVVSNSMYMIKDLVEKRSDGRIIVEVFPANQLFGDKETVDVLPSGRLDMAPVALGWWSGILPAAEIKTLICKIDTYEEQFRFTAGLEPLWDRECRAAKCKYIATIQQGSAESLCARKRVSTLADIKGLLVRVPTGILEVAFTALGAKSVSISVDEVYTALQRGTIDAGWSGAGRVVASKWYEIAPYVNVPPHRATYMFNYNPILMNLDKWNSFSQKDQEMIIKACREAGDWSVTEVKKDDDAAHKKLAELGVRYETSAQEWPKWVELMSTAQMEWLRKKLPSKLVDELVTIIDKAAD